MLQFRNVTGIGSRCKIASLVHVTDINPVRLTAVACPARPCCAGSIADTRARESLSGYLNVHMMLGAVQLVMAGLGIALITRFDSSCKGVLTDEALNILLIVVTTSQVYTRS